MIDEPRQTIAIYVGGLDFDRFLMDGIPLTGPLTDVEYLAIGKRLMYQITKARNAKTPPPREG